MHSITVDGKTRPWSSCNEPSCRPPASPAVSQRPLLRRASAVQCRTSPFLSHAEYTNTWPSDLMQQPDVVAMIGFRQHVHSAHVNVTNKQAWSQDPKLND